MRQSLRRHLIQVIVVAIGISTILPWQPMPASAESIVLSVTLPVALKSLTKDKIAAFENEHANIKVNVIAQDNETTSAIDDLDKHLQGAEMLVRTSDIVFADSSVLSPESTAAGYFLDLKPLVQQDQTLSVENYVPVAWKSMQWANGFWAFPATVTATLLLYDHAAFDQAGLAYPTVQWTIDDLDKAVRQLAERDSSGKVIRPGIAFTSELSRASLLRSLLGTAPFNGEGIPHFADNETLDHSLNVLAGLDADGLTGSKPEDAVMSTCCIYRLLQQNRRDQRWSAALLPGGHSLVIVQGFAVSAGTRYPEQAYALARSLSQTQQISSYFIDTVAAYHETKTDPAQIPADLTLPAATYALWMQALDQGVPQAEFQYFSYIVIALNKIAQGASIPTALQMAEQTGYDALKQAARRGAKTVISVATPMQETVQNANEVSLKFGLVFPTGFPDIPNQALWDHVIKDFTEHDTQVKAITLDMNFNPTQNEDDCFYGLASGGNAAYLGRFYYSLDPLIDVDSTFDKADVLEGALASVSADSKIWGYPLTIEPMVLSFDPDVLNKAGVPLPADGWTIDQFIDALKQLRPDSKAPPVFAAPIDPGNGTHLLVLMAAYGGLPLDFRTEPPTVNFTEPATVAAIQQVLDLAKQGYIQYNALGDFAHMQGPDTLNAPLSTQMLNIVAVGFSSLNHLPTQPSRKIVLFPSGTTQQALAYDIGAAYISNMTPHPEACYRWISTLAHHPELFSAMPATYSAINSPTLAVAQGSNAVAVYQQIAALMKSPGFTRFPLSGRSFPAFISSIFLYRAFDSYVLDNGDLSDGLKDAEVKARAFQECAKSIAPYNAADPQGEQVFLKAIDHCVTSADSSLSGIFAPR